MESLWKISFIQVRLPKCLEVTKSVVSNHATKRPYRYSDPPNIGLSDFSSSWNFAAPRGIIGQFLLLKQSDKIILLERNTNKE